MCAAGGADHQDQLFARALVEGTDDAVAVWVADGPASVDRLRRELSGAGTVELPPDTSQRDLLDNLRVAAYAVASAYPDAFLAAFGDPRWDGNGFVCAGLGAIHRPSVTRHLMRLLSHQDPWLRLDAVVVLRGHRHRSLRAALRLALEDSDDLVIYHAEQRLQELDQAGVP